MSKINKQNELYAKIRCFQVFIIVTIIPIMYYDISTAVSYSIAVFYGQKIAHISQQAPYLIRSNILVLALICLFVNIIRTSNDQSEYMTLSYHKQLKLALYTQMNAMYKII